MPSATNNRSPPRSGQRQHRRRALAPASFAVAAAVALFFGLGRRLGAANGNHAKEARDEDHCESDAAPTDSGWEEGPRPSSRASSSSSTGESDDGGGGRGRDSPPAAGGVRSASVDAVARYLNELARRPPSELWRVLGAGGGANGERGYGEDPFRLRDLEGGRCPWPTAGEAAAPDWLPPRPFGSEEMARRFRGNMEVLREAGRRQRTGPRDAGGEVAIWYEHVSKAGGTTFCGLAMSNMVEWQVPIYHCKPMKGKSMDGRVGTWSNKELVKHLNEYGHGIVSNEWEPFSLEKLQLSHRQLDGTPMNSNPRQRPRLLFLTTLRDPLDRLLSAYTFFAVTITKKDPKDAAPFDRWIDDSLELARGYRPGSRVGNCHRSNAARYNHVVWRFSGGELAPSRTAGGNSWEGPFERAVRVLCQHDLVLPMNVMTKEEGGMALRRLLGWERKDVSGNDFVQGDRKAGHVVTVGGVRNSNAREYFGEEEYRVIWEGNWLDNLLFLWCRAVFLARLHCEGANAES